MNFYLADDKHRSIEKQKARDLRKSRWWQNKIQNAFCYYCDISLGKDKVTMDHIVPISRGGKTTKGNVVISCKECNNKKKYYTPIEWDEFIKSQK